MWSTKACRIQVKLNLICEPSSICNNWQLCCLRTPGLPGGIYTQLLSDQQGKLASYIPELKKVAPEQFAIAACSVDGQQFYIGDGKARFCMQSMIKPILYALAIKESGLNYVHKHAGREPSGQNFNELTLNDKGLPHNPMINAGCNYDFFHVET